MKYFYSRESNAFYPSSLRPDYIASESWPADAIEVTSTEWQKYGQGQPPAGKRRGADANGRPCWVDLPAASLDELAATAIARINGGYTKAMAQILAEYPDAETLSFDKQEVQAREWQAWHDAGAVAADEPVTAYLDAMLVERPIGKDELVGRIIDKADQFTIAHGQATGRRQRLEDDIKAAKAAGDRAALEAIDW